MTLQMNYSGLYKVISGGQTGADQGGLLAAWRAGVETGGTAPSLYKTQIGHNPLLEVLGLTTGGDYNFRTRRNVLDSNATVIVAADLESSGSRLTRRLCIENERPYLDIGIADIVRLASMGPAAGTEPVLSRIIERGQRLADFCLKHQVGILNVAGNRELPSTGQAYGTMVITSITDWVVGMALELLELEGKLITRP